MLRPGGSGGPVPADWPEQVCLNEETFGRTGKTLKTDWIRVSRHGAASFRGWVTLRGILGTGGGRGGQLSSISGPHPLDARSTPGRDNHRCPQTWPSGPWGAESPPR